MIPNNQEAMTIFIISFYNLPLFPSKPAPAATIDNPALHRYIIYIIADEVSGSPRRIYPGV
jgi:hypothetical protein